MTDGATIPELIGRVRARGGRVEVRGADLAVDTTIFEGAPEDVDELVARKPETIGYLVSSLVRSPLPPRSGSTDPKDVHVGSLQRIWFDEATPIHERWIQLLWGLTGDFNVEAMCIAFERVLQRHAILRTSYQVTTQGVTGRMGRASANPLRVVDLRALDPKTADTEIWRMQSRSLNDADTSIKRPIELTLHLLNDGRAILGGRVHHSVFDERSAWIFWREFMGNYLRVANGQPDLPPLPRQYADLVTWERKWLTDQEQELADCRWAYELGRLAKTSSPCDLGPTSGSASTKISVSLSGPDLSILTAFARARSTTVPTIFMAVLARQVARIKSQSSVVWGLVNDLRPRGFEDVIGCFIGVRPFVARIDDGSDAASIVDAVKKSLILSREYRMSASPRFLTRHDVGKIIVNYNKKIIATNLKYDDAKGSVEKGKWSPGSLIRELPRFSPEGHVGSASALARLKAEPIVLSKPVVTEFHHDLHIAVIEAPGVWTMNARISSRMKEETIAKRILAEFPEAVRDFCRSG
jgi:hypothetical protein